MQNLKFLKSKKLFIYGASGHGKVVADIATEIGFKDIDFVDDGKNRYIDFNKFILKNIRDCFFALGIGDNKTRKAVYNKLVKYGYNIITLIHPKAIVAKNIKIGEGSVVMPGAIINIDTNIGTGVIVNSGSIIEHDCNIGDFVHISPNVSLAGNVKVGENSHVGIGASIIQNINIGRNCMVGAGAVVIDNVIDYQTAVGVPAKQI